MRKSLEELANDLEQAASQVSQAVAENESELRDFIRDDRRPSAHVISNAQVAVKQLLSALDEWKTSTEQFLKGQANILHPQVAVIVEDSLLDNGQGKKIDNGDHGLDG